MKKVFLQKMINLKIFLLCFEIWFIVAGLVYYLKSEILLRAGSSFDLMTWHFREKDFERVLIFFSLCYCWQQLIELQWRISLKSDWIFLAIEANGIFRNEEENQRKQDPFNVHRNYSSVLSFYIFSLFH